MCLLYLWRRVNYPYSDAGVMDTGLLLQDPTYSPQGLWLGSPMGTIFGTASNGNATAVILLVNVSLPTCPIVLCF